MGSYYIKSRTITLCVYNSEHISVLYTVSAPLFLPAQKKKKKGEKEGKKNKVKLKEGRKERGKAEGKEREKEERKERHNGWHITYIFLRL